VATTAFLIAASASVASAQNKPNILVIWGDDIGQFNISAYNRGMMGYKTPNIDSIANEGALFTDGMDSRAARQDVPPSSPDNHPFAQASPKSDFRARLRA
jgi:hypothetical protein